jgi:hypothetical protein
MKISLKKISEEKFEVKITEDDNVIFNDQRFYNYMDEIMVDKDKSIDTINQLSLIFGEFNEIENDFDI